MNRKVILMTLFFSSLIFQRAGHSADQSQSDPLKSLECLITTDFYIVHLTAYQNPADSDEKSKRSKFQRFCQELPNIGPSYLAIDLIDRDLRQMPIAVKVVEELKNEADGKIIETKIISQVESKIYKNGVAEIQVDFPKPGHYAMKAIVGDDIFADEIRIPLRVALGSGFQWPLYVGIAILIALAYFILTFLVRRHKQNQSESI